MAWQIWCARNDLQFEKIHITLSLCFKKSTDLLVDYKKASDGVLMQRASRQDVKWVPPDQHTVKINVDATVNMRDDKLGAGMVARNDSGNVLIAASKTMWPFSSVERAELEAIQWTMEIIKEHQWNNVIVEGDAQNVIKALQRRLNRSFHNQVIADNIVAASADIEHVSFSFCFREDNNVAHRLAKWASSSVCSSVWLNGGPPWIADIVLSDLSI